MVKAVELIKLDRILAEDAFVFLFREMESERRKRVDEQHHA